jgi:hypothetical protein
MTGVVFVGLIFIFIQMKIKGVQRLLIFYIIVLCACGLIFSSMTVTVGGGLLTIRFGLGIIRKKVRLEDVESCRTVRNPWYYGWGIRRIPGGWFYGVSGLSAVEVTLRSGKLLRIGTDAPDELEAAIREYGRVS